MKRIASLLLSLLLLVCLTVLPAAASDNEGTTVDGLVYVIEGDQVTINGYTGSASEIALPDEVDGYPVTAIGDYAFSNCEHLITVQLPDSLTYRGSRAFLGCKSLTELSVPEKVTSIGVFAFNKCESLERITLPEQLTSLGYGAFAGCTSLKELALPQELSAIEDYTFSGCTALEQIRLPRALARIGQYAFDSCFALQKVTCVENSLDSFEILEGNDALLEAQFILRTPSQTVFADAFLEPSSNEPKNLPLCIVIFVVLFIDGCLALAHRS